MQTDLNGLAAILFASEGTKLKYDGAEVFSTVNAQI
jgi:hypothetical protein